ncbi:MAG: N-acetylmuramidase family protein [Caldilineaceae bacterium]|nr:N-acetylmuramidase family protein [Caldilineaceae bacterium]
MSTRSAKVGVHGRNGDRWEDADYQVVRDAKIEVVKMMTVSNVDVFRRLKQENPDLQIITRLHGSGFGEGHHPTAEEYANQMIPKMRELQPYCTDFQVHNEPNHVHRYEGWGNSDDDARDFNAWFLDVFARLKQACPWASLGFPGLAVPDPLHRDKAWLTLCKPSIEKADWLGCHCYWQTPNDRPSVMLEEHSGLCFKYYHAAYPDKVIHILECGNSNGQGAGFSTDPKLYADEYVRWLTEVFKYPYVASTAFFILSSPDPVWDSFAWRTKSALKDRIVAAIGGMERPTLQAPQIQPPQPPPVDGDGVQIGRIPLVFSHQKLIDAFFNAATALGLGNWDLLTKAGFDVNQLAADRPAIFAGPTVDDMPGLSASEKTLVKQKLIVQMRRTTLWKGSVDAPAGLNMRAGSGGDQTVLELLPNLVSLDVLDDSGEWLFAAASDDLAGFVHMDFVQKPAAVQPIPPPPPPPPASKPTGVLALPGFLASMPELLATPLVPATPITLANDAGAGAQMLARIWNRWGGLVGAVAAKLGIDPAVAIAVLAVESGGAGFSADGRMIIRFENHLFYHYWGKQHLERYQQHFTFDSATTWQGHQWRATPDAPFQEFHGNQPMEWQVLTFARTLDDSAALRSISMGAPQILGSNFSRIGYANVQEMFAAFQASEANQLLGLFDFVKADAAMLAALRNKEYTAFASGYNGPGQASYYAGLIEKWVQAFALLQVPTAAAAASRSGAVAAASGLALDDDLDVAIAYLPMPRPNEIFTTVPPQGVREEADGKPTEPTVDPELYSIWVHHVEQGLANNNIMFKRVLSAFMVPYYMTVVMYVLLFLVGIGLFVVAARLSANQGTQLAGLLFGGLGVATFLGFFISKPLRSLEENLQFITWLGIVYNTYWTQLLYMQDSSTIHDDLKRATQEAVEQIDYIIERNAKLAGKRPDAKQD